MSLRSELEKVHSGLAALTGPHPHKTRWMATIADALNVLGERGDGLTTHEKVEAEVHKKNQEAEDAARARQGIETDPETGAHVDPAGVHAPKDPPAAAPYEDQPQQSDWGAPRVQSQHAALRG